MPRKLSADEARLTDEQRAEVGRHLGLVRYLAARQSPDADVRADFCQAGVFGLARAVQRFRPGLGVTFASYAKRHINDAIRVERWRRRLISLPRYHRFIRDHAAGAPRALQASAVDPSWSDPADHRGVPSHGIDADDAEALRAAWNRLPEDERRAVDGLVAGRTGREIAAELHCSHPYVYTLARSAIAALRAELLGRDAAA